MRRFAVGEKPLLLTYWCGVAIRAALLLPVFSRAEAAAQTMARIFTGCAFFAAGIKQ